MAHWFVIGFLVVLAIALEYFFEGQGLYLFFIGLVVLCYALIVLLGTYQARESVNTFNQQSAYIATHVPKNDIEDAALTQKKIELNGWLYKAQYRQDKFEAFSFYPESVQDLEPIQ